MAGTIHNVAASEEESLAMIRRYLSYMPRHVWELPPILDTDDPPQRAEEELIDIVPKNRRRPYDMRRLIELVVDRTIYRLVQCGDHFRENLQRSTAAHCSIDFR